MSERDSQGRFPQGTSGNRKGRPKAQKTRLETPEDFDEAILRIANRKVSGETGRGTEEMDLFTYNVMILGTGKAANRIATRDFIDMARSAASRKKRRMAEAAAEEERQRRIAELGQLRGF